MPNINLLIPTYNRPNYLKRLLDYYHKYGSDFDIIVADSSSDENKKLNKEIIQSFPDLNIQYVDKYSKETVSHNKFADMMNYAKRKYSVFCADDDFVAPDGIIRSVDFLEKNPDFTVAHGYYMQFSLKMDKVGEKQFCWQTFYPNESITFSDSKDRLFRHLSEYRLQTLYGVHRTEILKMIYGEFLNYKIDAVLFGEMFPGMLDLIYGKSECLDIFYMARQLDSSANNLWPTPIDFMNQGKYEVEYTKFRQCLAVHLSKNSRLSTEEAEKVVDDAMNRYIKKYYSPNLKQTLKNKASRRKILNELYGGARTIHRGMEFICGLLRAKDNLGSIYNFLPRYRDDFEKIKNQVINSKYEPI